MPLTEFLVEKKRVKTYSLGHTNTGVTESQSLVLHVGDDVDTKVLVGVELGRVRQGLIPNLVQRIRGVGDQLSQENLLVGVDSVDNEREQLRDLSLELESFGRHGECVISGRKGVTIGGGGELLAFCILFFFLPRTRYR